MTGYGIQTDNNLVHTNNIMHIDNNLNNNQDYIDNINNNNLNSMGNIGIGLKEGKVVSTKDELLNNIKS